MSSSVEIRREPPLRFVKLDAGPRNVVGIEAIRELGAALAADEEAPVVVFRGRQDGFCAGLDGRVLGAAGVAREELLAAMGELLLQALTGGTRIVSVCEGHAVAAGAMLLLVSDLRVGAPGNYKVGFTEPRLGMPLPGLPSILARERLDRRRLHALTVLGQVLRPEEAREAGFLDALVPADALEAEATSRAKEIAALSDTAYRGSLRSVWSTAIDSMREQVAAQRARADDARAGGR